MEDNEVLSGTMGMPNDELLKVIVDKVIDNGTAIKEAREQIRKVAVQGEAKDGLLVQMERVEQNFNAIEKLMVKGMEALGSRLDSYEKKMDPDRLEGKMQRLQNDLMTHTEYFEQPRRKEVYYRHFLGWPLISLIAMGFVLGGLGYLCMGAWGKARRYENSDIKWRYARMSMEPLVTHVLDSAEKYFQEDPEQFRKDVILEEERRWELQERMLQEQANRARIDQLQQRQKKR
ncbi:MAG TPA: hypothetical protein VGN00_16350 [Puia sp.]|jgi:hypothetical protein